MDKHNANNKKLENALDYSIKLLNSGASIEDCLKLYPNQRKELKDLLEAATCVKKAYPGYPELRPSKLYMKTGREKFLAAVEGGVPAIAPAVAKGKGSAVPRVSILTILQRRVVVASAAAAAALLITTGGLIHASDESLPGNPLYGVKRASENIKLALTLDKESKARLHYELAQRRVAEARRMAKAGERQEVARISEEAKDSLAQAEKLANKVVPPVKHDEIADALESLNSSTGKQLAKTTGTGGSDETTVTGNLKHDTKVAAATDGSGKSPADSGDSPNPPATTTTSEEKRGRTTTRDSSGTTLGKSRASLIPFEISSISISDEYVSPNGDGQRDTVSISIKGATEDTFRVEIYKGATLVGVIAEQASGQDLEVTWNGTDLKGNKLPDGEYTVKVSNSVGQLAHRRVNITVDTIAPSITLLEPPSGVETNNLQPRFVWKADGDVESYTLKLSLDHLEKEFNGLPEGFYTPETSLLPGKWRWSVVAIDKAGNAGKSDVRTILIKRDESGRQLDKQQSATPANNTTETDSSRIDIRK